MRWLALHTNVVGAVIQKFWRGASELRWKAAVAGHQGKQKFSRTAKPASASDSRIQRRPDRCALVARQTCCL